MKDFRSERMPSSEGKGIARATFSKAISSLEEAAEETLWPIVKPFVHSLTFDLFGFWLIWQLQGGFEGLQKPFSEGGWGMSRSAIFRRVSLFRRATGLHPDEYTIPGLELDLEAYWKASMERQADNLNS
jgi:hypothetical protein